MMIGSAPSQALISKLLNYGDCPTCKPNWGNYVADLNLSSGHIPDLISIAVDRDLNQLPTEKPESWAPIHARRALGQLGATAAIEPLMELFHNLPDNDWVGEELPKIYGMIGETAIKPLQKYLANTSHQLFSHLGVINSLEEVGLQSPNCENQVIFALTQQLEKYTENSPQLNSFIILSLVNLKATQSVFTIKHCFDSNLIADDIIGDWESVCTELEISDDALQSGFTDLQDRFEQDTAKAEPQNPDLQNQNVPSIDFIPLGVSNGEISAVTTQQEETESNIEAQLKKETEIPEVVESTVKAETNTPKELKQAIPIPDAIESSTEVKTKQETSNPQVVDSNVEVKANIAPKELKQAIPIPDAIESSTEVKTKQETSNLEVVDSNVEVEANTATEVEQEASTPKFIESTVKAETTIKPNSKLESSEIPIQQKSEITNPTKEPSNVTEKKPNSEPSSPIEENITVSEIESILNNKSTSKPTVQANRGFGGKSNQRKNPKKKKK